MMVLLGQQKPQHDCLQGTSGLAMVPYGTMSNNFTASLYF